jgi:hypothetical protein
MKRFLMVMVGIAIILATVFLSGSVQARDITPDANPRIDFRLTGAPHSIESEDSEVHSYFIVDARAKWIEQQEENSLSAEEVIRKYTTRPTEHSSDSPSEADAE